MSFLLPIGLFFLAHSFDLFYTYKYLREVRKSRKDYYKLELNFHQIFIKKYGLEKGLLFSGILSNIGLIILAILSILFMPIEFTYLCVGVVFGQALANFRSYQLSKTF